VSDRCGFGHEVVQLLLELDPLAVELLVARITLALGQPDLVGGCWVGGVFGVFFDVYFLFF